MKQKALTRLRTLSADRVRATFDYVPETGRLVRVRRGLGARVGVEVGYIETTGYRRAHFGGGAVMTAHLVWLWNTGELPTGILRHINGDSADDRIENLEVMKRPLLVVDNADVATDRLPAAGTGGIYEIVHRATGRRYIGSAVDFVSRWRGHQNQLVTGCHHSIALQRAWNKHGVEAFAFRAVVICDNRNLIFYEQRFISGMKPEFNCCQTAGSQLGMRHSEETRVKLRAAAVGRPSGFKGRKHTDESKRKNSATNTGRKRGPYSAVRVQRTAASMRDSIGALTEDQVRTIRSRKREGVPHAVVAKEIGCSYSAVADIARGRTFTWVNDHG